MMRLEIKKIEIKLLLIGLILSIGTISAQHDHGEGGGSEYATTPHVHHPPHGGDMKEVGKYHIEMATDLFLKKDQLSFYLFKGNYKPISNADITGIIIFEEKDGTTRTEVLTPKGNERFVAQLKNTASFHCKVEFLIKDKKISTTYIHAGLGIGQKSIYSCAMHPDIKRSVPGECPKCGMTLVKK